MNELQNARLNNDFVLSGNCVKEVSELINKWYAYVSKSHENACTSGMCLVTSFKTHQSTYDYCFTAQELKTKNLFHWSNEKLPFFFRTEFRIQFFWSDGNHTYITLFTTWFSINPRLKQKKKWNIFSINHISAFSIIINLIYSFVTVIHYSFKKMNIFRCKKCSRKNYNLIGTTKGSPIENIKWTPAAGYFASNLFISICWRGNSVPNFNQHWILIVVQTIFFFVNIVQYLQPHAKPKKCVGKVESQKQTEW